MGREFEDHNFRLEVAFITLDKTGESLGRKYRRKTREGL